MMNLREEDRRQSTQKMDAEIMFWLTENIIAKGNLQKIKANAIQ